MQKYARQQTATLLRRLAFQVSRADRLPDPGAVHDLRVAIRRFSRCLQVFQQFYPVGAAKKIRAALKDLMQTAGAVRDLDILLEFLPAASVPAGSVLTARLREQRRSAARKLARDVRHWKSRGFSRRWRTRLEL